VELSEAGEGAVVGLFYVEREDAGGQLVVFKVVGDTFTALALARAGLIGAGAISFVGFDVAFHGLNSNLRDSSDYPVCAGLSSE
jgi:hypothetical protein